MQEFFHMIQSDSTLIFIAGISVVVLLIIVLVVVVFSTKAKTLSDRLAESDALDRVKNIKIEELEKALQEIRIANAAQEQELQYFVQVKEELVSKTVFVETLQNENSGLEKTLGQTQTRLEELEKVHQNLTEEHKVLQERFTDLQEENNKFQVNNARLLMKLETESRHASSRLEMMQEHKREIKTEFERLAKQIFEGNSEKFAEFSKENLDSMIKPLQTQIEAFKQQVSQTYNIESQERAVLKNEIRSLKELNEKISKDAVNLTNALKGESKQQGVWGEMVLEHVLEASGLRKGFEFEREVSLKSDEGEVLRPDVIVHLPDNRDLIIDAKTSLLSYERYVNAEDEANKARHLAAHLNSIKMHIENLSAKNYERLKEVNTLDFIFMFMPIEGALAVALEHDSAIYDSAFKKKILLVGPTTLLVAMRAVENVWKYERQNQNAQEIARRAGAMYDKFVRFSEDLMKISRQIDAVQNSLSAAKNKLSDGKGNLVRQVQQLKELGAQTSKRIPKELDAEKE